MNCNILFFVRAFDHSFKHLIYPILKHILRQDCPVVNVSLATVCFTMEKRREKGDLFFLTFVRTTGLVVSKANVSLDRQGSPRNAWLQLCCKSPEKQKK